MSPLATSVIVFACVFGGALFGIALRHALPEHHLNAESRTAITMSQGMVMLIGALVLGLLVASAQSYYETQRTKLLEISGEVVLLDRILAHYGPETKEARDLLHTSVTQMINRIWAKGTSAIGGAQIEQVYDAILELSPKDDAQRTLKIQAVNTALEIGRARTLMYAQGSTSISRPLLAVVVFWIGIVLVSFGLFSPTNATVVSTLLLTAMSVSGAVFLILELYSPFHGLIQLSHTPLSNALAQLGR